MTTLVTVAVPLAIYIVALYTVYAALSRALKPFHLLLVASSAAPIVAAVLLAPASLPWALVVLAATPWVTVLGYELVGHRHNTEVLAAL